LHGQIKGIFRATYLILPCGGDFIYTMSHFIKAQREIDDGNKLMLT